MFDDIDRSGEVNHPALVYLSGSHIVSAAIFGALAIAGLYASAWIVGNQFAAYAAMLCAVAGYLSQLFAASSVFVEGRAFGKITWGFIGLAIVLWGIGAVSLFL